MTQPASPPVTRNAVQTRERILAAARVCFSRRSYEQVGLREIGQQAGVDAALVKRYFGNKEGLFVEVVDGAFDVVEHLPASLDELGGYLVGQIVDEEEGADDDGFNPLQLLLLSTTSPEIGAMVAASFHEHFVLSLAQRLTGDDAPLRAALIGSYVIGLATMRHLLVSPALQGVTRQQLTETVVAAIQRCVAGTGDWAAQQPHCTR